jgi:hypothetical protein
LRFQKKKYRFVSFDHIIHAMKAVPVTGNYLITEYVVRGTSIRSRLPLGDWLAGDSFYLKGEKFTIVLFSVSSRKEPTTMLHYLAIVQWRGGS